jgi:hypothetical protein
MSKWRSRLLKLVPVVIIVAALGIWYVKSHPLVFNESLWEHAHCMPQAAGAILQYAHEHDGQFPYSTNGWGNALMMLTPERSWFYIINGPGYDNSAFEEAFASGGKVDEKRCGRVYVQGLSVTNDAKIAVLFDKIAAPPDHCQFPRRLWAGFVREVCFVDGDWRMVPVAEWPEFARQQVDLLVAAGFSRARAQQLYSEVK